MPAFNRIVWLCQARQPGSALTRPSRPEEIDRVHGKVTSSIVVFLSTDPLSAFPTAQKRDFPTFETSGSAGFHEASPRPQTASKPSLEQFAIVRHNKDISHLRATYVHLGTLKCFWHATRPYFQDYRNSRKNHKQGMHVCSPAALMQTPSPVWQSLRNRIWHGFWLLGFSRLALSA